MSTSLVFNASSTVQDVRDVFSGKTLAIMAYFFPSDKVKDLLQKYEDTPGGPPELKGMPSGAAAVNFDAVTPATKSALLTAQAAERTVRLAAKAATLAEDHDDLVSSGKAPDFDQVGGKYLDHDDFKWVGSDKDPALLQKAQGTMMAAQEYLNNEALSIVHAIQTEGAFDNFISEGTDPYDGFLKVAAKMYSMAAKELESEGHDALVPKLKEASRNIAKDIKNANAPSPSDTISHIDMNRERGRRDVNIVLGPHSSGGEYAPENKDYRTLLHKAKKLSSIDLGFGGNLGSKPQDPKA